MQFEKIIGIFGDEDQTVFGGETKVNFIIPARGSRLTRCNDLMAGGFQQSDEFLGVRAIIEVDFLAQEGILVRLHGVALR